MAAQTAIAYVHHTYNPWWGCSAPAGAGCDHCFACAFDKRTGGENFGLGTRPRLTSLQNRKEPTRWHKAALAAGERRRVLTGSMMDWADKHAPEGGREEIFDTIAATPALDYMLLTKRAPSIRRYLPGDWGDGYRNAWLGVTVEDRKSGLRRLEMLREVPAVLRFISVEPMLEDLGDFSLEGIGWVICGGESGAGCRPLDEQAAMRLWARCRALGIPFFYKQRGGNTRDKGGCLLGGVEIKEIPVLH